MPTRPSTAGLHVSVPSHPHALTRRPASAAYTSGSSLRTSSSLRSGSRRSSLHLLERPTFQPDTPLFLQHERRPSVSGGAPLVASTKLDVTGKVKALHDEASTLLHERNDCEGALAQLNRAIGLMPSSPALFEARGLVYRKLGKWSQAIADYASARSLQEAAMAIASAQRPTSAKPHLGTQQRLPRGSSERTAPAPASSSARGSHPTSLSGRSVGGASNADAPLAALIATPAPAAPMPELEHAEPTPSAVAPSGLGGLSARELEAVLLAASASPEERSDDEVGPCLCLNLNLTLELHPETHPEPHRKTDSWPLIPLPSPSRSLSPPPTSRSVSSPMHFARCQCSRRCRTRR